MSEIQILSKDRKYYKNLFFRFVETSCSTLEPQYVQENYASLNLGPETLNQASKDETNFFGAPKKLNNRQPPFEIETDFIEYRKNKNYISK